VPEYYDEINGRARIQGIRPIERPTRLILNGRRRKVDRPWLIVVDDDNVCPNACQRLNRRPAAALV
jgi:hypothetical protein